MKMHLMTLGASIALAICAIVAHSNPRGLSSTDRAQLTAIIGGDEKACAFSGKSCTEVILTSQQCYGNPGVGGCTPCGTSGDKDCPRTTCSNNLQESLCTGPLVLSCTMAVHSCGGAFKGTCTMSAVHQLDEKDCGPGGQWYTCTSTACGGEGTGPYPCGFSRCN
jgi:hypothetical protein